MKHHKKGRSFGRSLNQRNALMRSMARSLVLHGKITTTEAKAKSLRPFVEKLITSGKTKSVASLRTLVTRTGSVSSAHKITADLSTKYADRKGGYTRIMKLPRRLSDGSPMAIIEFV